MTKGLPKKFLVKDELYHIVAAPDGAKMEVLAETSNSTIHGKLYPSVWVVKHPKARIVCIAIGHDGDAHELAEYQALLQNAVSWTAEKAVKD